MDVVESTLLFIYIYIFILFAGNVGVMDQRWYVKAWLFGIVGYGF